MLQLIQLNYNKSGFCLHPQSALMHLSILFFPGLRNVDAGDTIKRVFLLKDSCGPEREIAISTKVLVLCDGTCFN